MGFLNRNCKNFSLGTFTHLVALLLTLNCVLTAIKPTTTTAEAETVDGGQDYNATETSKVTEGGTESNERLSVDHVMGARHELQFWHGFSIGAGGWRDGRGPPCFSLSRAHPLTRSCRSACNVIFEHDIVAVGGNYDRKSGHFFCHIPGLYFITFSAISQAYSSFRLALIKNEQETVSAYGAADGYDTSGNSIVLPLQRGDKISLALLEGELYESEAPYRAYTTFSGFLIPFPNPGHDDGNQKTPPPYRPFEKPPEPGKPFPGFIGGGGVFPEAGPRSSLPVNTDVEILQKAANNTPRE